jgi:hypothetical protein
VLAADFIDSTQANPLSASDITWDESQYLPTASATISNSFGADLESVETHAIAFNANGDIIGGGWSFADEAIPAGGAGPAEILMYPGDTPASVQVFATVSSFLDIVP